jgi:hypothetical protein
MRSRPVLPVITGKYDHAETVHQACLEERPAQDQAAEGAHRAGAVLLSPKQPAGGGEERPIGCAVDRALHLPAEDTELVAEDRDLDLRLGRHAILRSEQAEDAVQEEIGE